MKIFVINYNAVIPNLKDKGLEYVHKDDFMTAMSLVMWNDVVYECRQAAESAHKRNVPVYVVQHGLITDERTEYFHTGMPPLGSHVFAWTEDSRARYLEDGVREFNTSVVGCPLFEYWRKPNPDGKSIVFVPPHTDDDANGIRINKDSLAMWEKIKEISPDNSYVKLVMGYHPMHEWRGKRLITNRYNDFHGKGIFDALENASVIVTQDEGTFAFLSYSMNVPVIKVGDNYPNVTNSACVSCGVDDLEKEIKNALSKPDLKKQERMEATFKYLGVPWDSKAKDLIADKILKSKRLVVA